MNLFGKILQGLGFIGTLSLCGTYMMFILIKHFISCFRKKPMSRKEMMVEFEKLIIIFELFFLMAILGLIITKLFP